MRHQRRCAVRSGVSIKVGARWGELSDWGEARWSEHRSGWEVIDRDRFHFEKLTDPTVQPDPPGEAFFVPAHTPGSLQTIGIRDSGGLLDAGASRVCGGRGGRVPRRITASDFDLSFPSWKRKAPLPCVVLVFCCFFKKKSARPGRKCLHISDPPLDCSSCCPPMLLRGR